MRARQLRRRKHDRADVLTRAIARLRRSRAPTRYSWLWTDAIYGWGNEEWSAEEPYLAEVVRSAERTSGSILECGSGLTTLLVGTVAMRRGIRLHSLEHNADWHERISRSLHDEGITGATVHLTPLRNFGDYEWYESPLSPLPDQFSLIVCDGPPASTRGGRIGVMPQMGDSFSAGCVILLDDLIRPAEQDLVQRWIREYGATAKLKSGGRRYARVELPRTKSGAQWPEKRAVR